LIANVPSPRAWRPRLHPPTSILLLPPNIHFFFPPRPLLFFWFPSYFPFESAWLSSLHALHPWLGYSSGNLFTSPRLSPSGPPLLFQFPHPSQRMVFSGGPRDPQGAANLSDDSFSPCILPHTPPYHFFFSPVLGRTLKLNSFPGVPHPQSFFSHFANLP